jgi:hypothetical protein
MRVLAHVVQNVSLPSTAQIRRMEHDQNGDKKLDDEDEEEGPNCKKVFIQNMTNVVNILCTWDCGNLWIKLSEILVSGSIICHR